MLGVDPTSEAVLYLLKAIGDEIGGFALGILNDELTQDEQIIFAHKLVDLAEAIRDRAVAQTHVVIEGSSVDSATTGRLSCPPTQHERTATSG